MTGPCAKQTVTATLISKSGRRYVGSNYCLNPQTVCPRGDLPSGVGYELCVDVCQQVGHGERVAIRLAGADALGSTIYVEGHTYICELCQQDAAQAGVERLILGSPNV